MRKITILTVMFMASVYGMDTHQLSQKSGQEKHETDIETLSKEDNNSLSTMPKDVLPAINNYNPAKIQLDLLDLQKTLNQAKSIEEIIALGTTDNHSKSAPLKLDLYKFNANVTDEILEEIVKLFPQLVEIDLFRCKKITDAGIAHLKGLTNLQNLNLGHINFTKAGVAHLASLTQLKTLKLSHNGITDEAFKNLHLDLLISLDISENNITDEGLSLLSSVTPELTKLVMEGTRITPNGLLIHLHKFKSLTELDVGESAAWYEDVAGQLMRKMPKLHISGEH